MKNRVFIAIFLCILFCCSIIGAQQLEIDNTAIETRFALLGNEKPASIPDLVGLNYIIPDFQVNDVSSPAVSRVSGPAIASDSSGNYVVTWEAENNGDYNIYAQYYAHDGRAINGNFIVNDDYGTRYQGCPDIAMDDFGNFIIVWHDKRNSGLSDIYGQRYSYDGSALGKNFKVHPELNFGSHQYPSVATDGAGNIVITWEVQDKGDYDIWAQRFTADGIKVEDGFKVSDQVILSAQHYPDICADDSGRFVITWQDTRNQRYEIYAQCFSNQGLTVGENFRVSGKNGELYKPIPAIAANKAGNFVIVWEDKYNGPEYHEIYGQKFNCNGETIGNAFRANLNQGGVHELPDIAFNNDGKFLLTWVHDYNGKKFVRAQRYGGSESWDFKVNSNYDNTTHSAVTCIGYEKFVLTWQNDTDGERNIFNQSYSMAGEFSENAVKVNVNRENQTQNHPTLDLDNQGNMVISWQDYQAGLHNPHIYAQFYGTDGVLKGNCFRVDTDNGAAELPSAAIGDNETGIIVWQSSQNENYDIFLQPVSPDGIIDSTRVQIMGDEDQINPSVSAGNSNFVVTWQDSRNGNYDIYAQLYSIDFIPKMPHFKVNDDLGIAHQTSPVTAMNSSGLFCMTWQDSRNGWDDDIYLQCFDNMGMAQGVNIRVNDEQINAEQAEPVVAIDGAGNYIVTWRDHRNGLHDPDIYAQCYFHDGTLNNTNFRVNDDLDWSYQFNPSIAADSSGNFLITWVDTRNGNYDIYTQRYDSDGTQIGSNFRITGTGQNIQLDPVVKIQDNKIYSLWTDNRAGDTGYDIWANVLDWSNPSTGVASEKVSRTISNFRLEQNYPNPFNPKTTIQYDLPEDSFVELQILNIRGQLMKNLVSELRQAGHHQCLWNGTDIDGNSVPSGIYFYRLKAAKFNLTRRMVLMK